jgi:hypothetical protein
LRENSCHAKLEIRQRAVQKGTAEDQRGRQTRCGWRQRRKAADKVPSGVEGYLALFDPEATLQDPGMAEPISGDDIRDFITRGLNSVTDYRLVPTNWAARGDTLFIEARQSAHIAGREVMAGGALSQIAGRSRADGRAYCDPTIVAKPLAGSAA